MTPRAKGKEVSAAMRDREFKATMKRIDAHLKSVDASLRKLKTLDKKMAPDMEALRRYVEHE